MPVSLSPPLVAAASPEAAAPPRQWWERVRLEPDVVAPDAVPRHDEPRRTSDAPAAMSATAAASDGAALPAAAVAAAAAAPATPQRIAASPSRSRPALHLDTSPSSASPVSPFFPPSSSSSGGAPHTPAAADAAAAAAAEPPAQQRSPAADFLSAFASMHSVLDGDAPAHAHTADEAWGTRSETRTRSLSPLFAAAAAAPSADAGSSTATYGASAPESGSPSAPFGLGSAAASLFAGAASGSARLPSSMPPQHAAAARRTLAPDDEGATLAGGRYVLGRAVGYGGSSVVREGWAQTSATELDMPASSTRVAVKIVRLDTADDTVAAEVALWQSLPPHAHLLPLLHHEEMPLAPGSEVRVLFLVMPFADAGSLLDYVRNEGVPKRLGAAAGSSGGLSRASSMHTQLSNGGTAGGRTDYSARVAAAAAPMAGRTGSGFLPRSSAARTQSGAPLGGHGRIFSDGGQPSGTAAGSGGNATSSAPYRRGTVEGYAGAAGAFSPASNAGSLSASGAAGLLRRASSRAAPPRSRGLPLGSARRVLAQLTSALEALQAEGVRHGDLKLENVLGQSREPAGDGDAHVEATTWRLADFGLARKSDEPPRAPPLQAPAPAAGDEKSRKSRAAGRASDIGPAPRGLSSSFPTLPRGGSLAYAAPETLREVDDASNAERPDAHAPAGSLVYAQDMWALGCVFYALLSGRLPFADSFEPRLQAKIVRGIWTLPPRLARRRPRRSAPGSDGDGLPATSSAMSPSGSAQSFTERSRPDSWASFSGNFGGRELLSSSVSSLPPSGTVLQEEENASDTEDEGDEETRLWDGDRLERQEARDVLRGLLEPEPTRRWTLADVLASPCLARLREEPSSGEERGRHTQAEPLRFERQASRERAARLDSDLSHSRPDVDLPPASHAEAASPYSSSVRSRPSSPFHSPGDAQENMPPRGRRRGAEMALLREGHAWHASSAGHSSAAEQHGARPIDIVSTRSASASRSRSRSRQACEREAAGYNAASLRHRDAAQSPEQMRGRKPLLHRSSSYEGSSSAGLPGGTASASRADRGSSSRSSRSGARSTSRPRMLAGVPSSAGATTSGNSGSSGWTAEFVFPPANGDGFRWRSSERSSSSRTNAARSSTSRSRSRAPEALANLLARERVQQQHLGQHGDAGSSVPSSPAPGTPTSGTEDSSRSRERGARSASSGLRARASTDALPSPRPGSALPRNMQQPRDAQAEGDEDEPEMQWWQRGRAREPKPAPPAHSPEQARAVLPGPAASTPPAIDEARRAVPRWPWDRA